MNEIETILVFSPYSWRWRKAVAKGELDPSELSRDEMLIHGFKLTDNLDR